MIYIVNIFTVILAIAFALQFANEKRAYLISLVAIISGVALHLYEAYKNQASGICEFSNNVGFIENIDRCIKYESGSMLYAQAAILAGFTVMFIKFTYKKHNSSFKS